MTFENADPKLILVNVNVPNGGTQWQLDDDYDFYWEFEGDWYRFTIPDGFQSDGASVPFWLRWIADRGRFGKLAPLVHDWLHSVEGRVVVQKFEVTGWTRYWARLLDGQQFTRREADKLFFRIMREQGVKPRWLRRGAYKAVSLLSRLKGDRWN